MEQSLHMQEECPAAQTSQRHESTIDTTKEVAEREHIVADDFQDMPIIDLEVFMDAQAAKKDCADTSEKAAIECQKVAECFHKFGILLIRDPRVDMKDNDDYIDLIEDYFERTGELFYSGEKVDDIKAEHHYQVGATPEHIEKARCHKEKLAALELAPEDCPVSPIEPVLDAKWRFMWKIGERFEDDQADFPQVVPEGFADWEKKMNTWGGKLHDALKTVSEMAALGMGVPKDTFSSRMEGGAHLLAPTGSDLERYQEEGTVFAGFHYDISFMTIHGKSRYPGLYVWTRNWKKRAVKIPQGCLLIQAGLSFEHITGGYVLAGFHEVVHSQGTKDAYEKRKAQLERDGICKKQWRVSSTMFCHFGDKVQIGPLKELAHMTSPEQAARYPPITAYEILMQELNATGMSVETKEATDL